MELLMKAKTLALVACIAINAQAGMLPNRLQIYPESIQQGSPFLLSIQDTFGGCGGSLRMEVTRSRIEVIAEDRIAEACPRIVIPVSRLYNPRASLPAGIDFDARIDVVYSKRTSGGTSTETESVTFVGEPEAPIMLDSGSFITTALEASGLYLDQQGKTLTLTLNDYENGRGTWFFGSGQLNGNVFIGQLSSFNEIVCIRAPCPRSAPARSGDVMAVFLSQQEVIASFSASLNPNFADQVFEYQRFEFAPTTLPSPPATSFKLPDLSGKWIGGLSSTESNRGMFTDFSIRYRGQDDSRGLTDYYFDAIPIPATGGSQPIFTVRCADERPVDGIVGCSIEDYQPRVGLSCDSSFSPGEVGPKSLTVAMSCSERESSFETSFVLRRLQ
jgi:hypothetical protein